MIDKAILLAAPASTLNGEVGPLTEVGGSPLIKRTLLALEHHDVMNVVVVVGKDGDEVIRQISADPDIGCRITWVSCKDDDQSRVSSLLQARPYVDGPALVLHANLLFSPQMLSAVVEGQDNAEVPTLLVDFELSRVFDFDSALRVQCRGDRVIDIGRDVPSYNATAVGIAVVTPELLDRFSEWQIASTSQALRAAAKMGLLTAQDVEGAQWQQIDSPQTKLHAEWLVRAYGQSLVVDQASDSCPSDSAGAADPKRTLSYIEGLLSEKRARHYVLLNPGPVLTSARVKSALVHHDVCHRDEDCSAVTRRIQHKLRRVCRGGPEHDVLLLSGSGTAAMEATLASCVPDEGKLLIVSNGAFGERFAEIAAVHKFDTVHKRYEWGELVDPTEIEQCLREDSGIVAVVMCHHETSVGLLNPVQEVGSICRELNRLFFVDAVSSLGGEDVDVRRDKIDVLFSSANKCLHAISGVSFVCVNQRIWPRIEHVSPRVYYLDLRAYHRAQIPFTPAVSNLFALDAALDELLNEGVARRIAHYERLNQWLRRELRRLGLQPMTETGRESHTITTWQVPDYLRFDQLYRSLKRRGYIIYSCKAQLKDRCFQIANMGVLTDEMVEGFIQSMELVLRQAASRSRPELRVAS